MAIVIPFAASTPRQSFTTTIENASYLFTARWVGREGAWYFDVAETDETPIASGIKVVLGVVLGRRCHHPLFRRGIFVAADLSGAGREAGLDDFGADGRVQVVRLTLAEALSLRVTSTFPDAAAIAAAKAYAASTEATG